MIIEKDAENEAKSIFIELITKKRGRMGLLQNNAGPKSFCLTSQVFRAANCSYPWNSSKHYN